MTGSAEVDVAYVAKCEVPNRGDCYIFLVTLLDYPDQCPPAEARDYEGAYYRFASENPEDFTDQRNYQSYFKLGKPFPPQLDCNARGLSGYKSEEDLEIARKRLEKRFPAFKKYPTLVLDVESQDGLLCETPSKSTGVGHCTLWVFEEIDISQRRRC